MLDCCYSGGFSETKSIASNHVKNGLSDTALEEMSGVGRAIFSSSREDEVSLVYPNARNSVFTTYLLEGLKGAAADPDGYIRLFGLFDYIQPRVRDHEVLGYSKQTQTPVLKLKIEENFAIAYRDDYKQQVINSNEQDDTDDFRYDVYISYYLDKSDDFQDLGGYQVVQTNTAIKNSKKPLFLFQIAILKTLPILPKVLSHKKWGSKKVLIAPYLFIMVNHMRNLCFQPA